MGMIYCADCNKQISESAVNCPNCGKPNIDEQIEPVGVSFKLFLGIFLIPFLFAFYTLRKGYSTKSKVLSFAWMFYLLVVYMPLFTVGKNHNASVNSVNNTTNQRVKTRVFVEKDFYFDDETYLYKSFIIKGVNKIYKENARCETIKPATAYLSIKSISVDNPIFFVTCSQKNIPFNVFFSQSDVVSNKSMAEKKHIKSTQATRICENYAKSKATHPNTLDFSRFLSLSSYEAPNGTTRVNSKFTAKNSFNLELEYRISCLIDINGLIDAEITEAS